jgi:hypothetical protein
MIDNLKKRYEQLQGLLNTPMNQGGGLLGNIPQGALLGSAIYGQGIQGRDPFSALLPAVAQTAQIQKLMTPKASKPFEAKNIQTGQNVFITPQMYAKNPQLYQPIEKKPLIQQQAGETEEQKLIGKAFGQKFTDINTAAESAQKNMGNLQTIETLIQQPDLKTGFLGEFRTNASKLAKEFGFDFQNVPAAEVLSTTTGALVLEGLSNFKGSISDGERKFVKDINAGLNMSKEGIAANIALQKKGNEITLKYNEEANDWVERNDGLSKKDKISGKSWSQFTTKFHKENPLISNEERENLSNLSKSYDQEFLEGNNVQTINGVRYVMIGGKLYELD